MYTRTSTFKCTHTHTHTHTHTQVCIHTHVCAYFTTNPTQITTKRKAMQRCVHLEDAPLHTLPHHSAMHYKRQSPLYCKGHSPLCCSKMPLICGTECPSSAIRTAPCTLRTCNALFRQRASFRSKPGWDPWCRTKDCARGASVSGLASPTNR